MEMRLRDQRGPVETDQEAAGNRRDQQQGPEGQPMADHLGRADRFIGRPGQRQLIEHAIRPVRFDQPLDRQQCGRQRRNPKRAAADPAEKPGIGSDCKRNDGRDQQEECDRKPGAP